MDSGKIVAYYKITDGFKMKKREPTESLQEIFGIRKSHMTILLTTLFLISALVVSAASTDSGHGLAIASIGDINGDGIEDIAIGTSTEENIGHAKGAIYILLMNSTGIASYVRIADGTQGFAPDDMPADANFGKSIASLGDIDSDGIAELEVGAPRDGYPEQQGASFILFLTPTGQVRSHAKASGTEATGMATAVNSLAYAANASDAQESDDLVTLNLGIFMIFFSLVMLIFLEMRYKRKIDIA